MYLVNIMRKSKTILIVIMFSFLLISQYLLYKEYRDLEEEYRNLEKEYRDLKTRYIFLKSGYDVLCSEKEDLARKYKELKKKYDSLQSRYKLLERNYSALSYNYKALVSKHRALEESYRNLDSKYRELLREWRTYCIDVRKVSKDKYITVLLYMPPISIDGKTIDSLCVLLKFSMRDFLYCQLLELKGVTTFYSQEEYEKYMEERDSILNSIIKEIAKAIKDYTSKVHDRRTRVFLELYIAKWIARYRPYEFGGGEPRLLPFRTGICSEGAWFVAFLLKELGYKCIVVCTKVGKLGHAQVGVHLPFEIKCPLYESASLPYYVVYRGLKYYIIDATPILKYRTQVLKWSMSVNYIPRLRVYDIFDPLLGSVTRIKEVP